MSDVFVLVTHHGGEGAYGEISEAEVLGVYGDWNSARMAEELVMLLREELEFCYLDNWFIHQEEV